MASKISEKVYERASKADGELLPKKSRPLYERELQKFEDWKKRNSVTTVSETVLMGYLQELLELFIPNSLWSKYSMLKATLLVYNKLDIGKFNRLEAFRKQTSKGYIPRMSKILTRKRLKIFQGSFKRHVPFGKSCSGDGRVRWIATGRVGKVHYRRYRRPRSRCSDQIQYTKTGGSKSFNIVEENEMSALQIYRKYAALHPKGLKERHFFLCYRNGRCTAQPVGKNTFGSIPSKVAKYLGYADAREYTGHCLHRTSVTLLVLTLKRHGKWKSDAVASGYIEDSIASKNKIARMIAGAKVTEGETPPTML